MDKRSLFSVILAGALVHPATAAGDTHPSDFLVLPAGCHARAFSESNFLDFESIRPEQKIAYADSHSTWKYDVVCIGSTFHLTSNIYTNGGTVVILADKIILDGTIDTRVYRRHNLAKYFLSQAALENPKYGSNGFRDRWTAYQQLTNPAADPSYGTQKLFSAYKQYYNCLECRKVSNELFIIPRMLDGFTPPFRNNVNKALDGEAPPTEAVDPSTFRSGDVVLVAGKVDLREGATGNFLNIIVRGLPGGIGGLGEPYFCTGWNKQSGKYTYSCGPKRPSLSESAAGGPGGAAGNVFIYTPEQKLLARVKSKIDSSGGTAASSEILGHPLVAGGDLGKVYTGTISDFRRLRTGPRRTGGGTRTNADTTNFLHGFVVHLFRPD